MINHFFIPALFKDLSSFFDPNETSNSPPFPIIFQRQYFPNKIIAALAIALLLILNTLISITPLHIAVNSCCGSPVLPCLVFNSTLANPAKFLSVQESDFLTTITPICYCNC